MIFITIVISVTVCFLMMHYHIYKTNELIEKFFKKESDFLENVINKFDKNQYR